MLRTRDAEEKERYSEADNDGGSDNQGREWTHSPHLPCPLHPCLLLLGVTQKLSLQWLNSWLHLLLGNPLLYHLLQEAFPGCCVRRWAKRRVLEPHNRNDLFSCLTGEEPRAQRGTVTGGQLSNPGLGTQGFPDTQPEMWGCGVGQGIAVLSKRFLLKCHLFNYF